VGRTKAQREHCVYYLVGKRRSGKQSRHLGVFSFLFFCFLFFDSCSFFSHPLTVCSIRRVFCFILLKVVGFISLFTHLVCSFYLLSSLFLPWTCMLSWEGREGHAGFFLSAQTGTCIGIYMDLWRIIHFWDENLRGFVRQDYGCYGTLVELLLDLFSQLFHGVWL